jgi:hypothetical protein
MSSNYYYLVSSLPDLRLDDYKEPYRVNELIDELYINLDPEHFQYIKDILYMNDIPNIVDIVCKSGNTWLDARGNYTFDQMRELFENPEVLDEKEHAYIIELMSLIEGLKSEGKQLERLRVEQLIWKNYYLKMTSHKNEFIKKYYNFDYHLRNLLLAVSKRKFKAEDVSLLDIAEDDLVKKLKTSTATDFGLGNTLDYLQLIIDAFEKNDIIYREKLIDQLRWDMIDQFNTFAYFKIDVLLGFLIKLILVERWIAMGAKQGKEAFEKITKVDEQLLEKYMN